MIKDLEKRDICSNFRFINREKVDKNTEKYIKELLFIAWNDLASASLLYEAKIYNNAIYFLQQSVEKTTKAWGIIGGSIDIKESKSYMGHKSELLVNKETIRILKVLAKEKNEEPDKEALDFFENKFQKKSNNLFLSFLPKSEIKKYIKLGTKKGPQGLIKLGKFKLIGSNIFDKRISRKDKIINLDSELYFLSNLLSSHEMPSRYPNKEISPLDYQNLPLIKCFHEIEKIMMRILGLLDAEMLQWLLDTRFFHCVEKIQKVRKNLK